MEGRVLTIMDYYGLWFRIYIAYILQRFMAVYNSFSVVRSDVSL